MRTIIAIGFLIASLNVTRAQVVQGETQERPTLNKEKKLELQVPARTRTASEALRKPVSYSGFLVDLARTNRPRRLLSLRNPTDPKRDMQNLLADSVTGRAMGFKLFSIDF